jgi:nucleotide-binding universal stress UspA family protein
MHRNGIGERRFDADAVPERFVVRSGTTAPGVSMNFNLKVGRMAQVFIPFNSILVPLDGSALAEEALPLAARIARAAGGKLRLALVHQPPAPPIDTFTAKMFTSIELASRKAERAYLRARQAKLREEGLRLSSAVTLAGAVGPTLAEYVRELGVDLVVMATHGRGGVQRAWLGSVADYLVRHLEVPVVLVRPAEKGAAPTRGAENGQILVPLDGSALAEEALQPAAALARAWDAELTLLQVVTPAPTLLDPALSLPSSYDADFTASWRDAAQDYLDDVVERLRGEGLRASGVAVIGRTAVDTIIEVARPERVTLVAIATHGRGGLRRLALGSVADKLIRSADVPVLVQRPSGSRRAKPRAGGGRTMSARVTR